MDYDTDYNGLTDLDPDVSELIFNWIKNSI